MDHWQLLFDNNTTSSKDASSHIPTMAFIELKVAQEDGTNLDQNQIVTYESICSTFLLQLVNDGEDNSTSV